MVVENDGGRWNLRVNACQTEKNVGMLSERQENLSERSGSDNAVSGKKKPSDSRKLRLRRLCFRTPLRVGLTFHMSRAHGGELHLS